MPETKEVGMIRVDCNAIKKLLVPSPQECFKTLQQMLPRICRDRVAKEAKWLKDQINDIKKPALKVNEYVA